MKQRCPHSAGGAFCRVKDILTAKVCAEFLGVTAWTVYDRCDAAMPGELNMSYGEALELDGMCAEKTGETPLTDYAVNSLKCIRDAGDGDEDLNRKLHMMTVAYGELCKIVAHIDDPAAMAQTSRLSENDRISLLQQLEPIRNVLAQMEKSLAPRKGKVL